MRMRLLHAASKYTSKISDLRTIYKMFIRSILEYSAVLWHSSLTEKNTSDIERIQKTAVKIILNDRDMSYEEGLKRLHLDKLEKRREKLCLSFAKKCLKNEKVKMLFPLNKNNSEMLLRNSEKFKVNQFNTERYRNSAIPFLQNLLNKENRTKMEFIRARGT